MAILFLFLLVIVLVAGDAYLFYSFFKALHAGVYEVHKEMNFITADEYDAQMLAKAKDEYRFPWEGQKDEDDRAAILRW